MQETSEISVALQWATEIFGLSNVAKYYISPNNFLNAYRNGNSFSFTVKGNPVYGHAYGSAPHYDPRWGKVAVADFHPEQILGAKPRYGFEFWALATAAANVDSHAAFEVITDTDLINQILDQSAPDSSVRPGGNEEIFWGGIRNEAGEVASIGVLVKWQSGQYVVASVATREEDRGKGYATALVAAMGARAHSLGIAEIGLGVRDNNFAAQRAYEKAGFTRLAAFTNYFQE